MLLSRVTRFKMGLRLTKLGFDNVDLNGVIPIACAFSEKFFGSDLDPGQADKFVLKWRYLAQRAHG